MPNYDLPPLSSGKVSRIVQPDAVSRYNRELMSYVGAFDVRNTGEVRIKRDHYDAFPRLLGDVASPASLQVVHVPLVEAA